MSLSVYIITCNNASTLPLVLESVKDADEIVVVDSGSTDETLEIAKHYTDKVVHQDWLGYAKQKAFAMSLCTKEWTLSLDSDEIVENNGIQKIRNLIANTQSNGFYILRREYMLGKPILGRKAKFMRLYKKAFATWDTTKLVHEHINVTGSLEKTSLTINHLNITDITEGGVKVVTYAKLKAQQKKQQGKRTNGLKVLLIYPIMFAKFYLIKGYILSGIYGMIYAHLQANYFYMVEVCLYTGQVQEKSQTSKL
jgi:glycosyltransferase involved in cell wall biosynthesis